MPIRALRLFLIAAGLILSMRTASAQITGEVQSIGLNGYYRGGCWTPMRIVLRTTAAQARQVEIRVSQLDLDHDTVNYTRTVTLNGAAAGDQIFWTCFIPQTVDGGLPSAGDGGTLDDLRAKLKVGLYDPDGGALTQLSLSALPTDVNRMGATQGTRLVLLVRSPGSLPNWQEFLSDSGLLERVVMVSVAPEDLPPDVIGYAGVDAVVWLNAPPPDPRLPSQRDRFEALDQYIRQGGRLVVCHSSQWREMADVWGEMLPVKVATVARNEDLSGLVRLAQLPKDELKADVQLLAAAAVARPDAIVDVWMNWPASTTQPAPTTSATSRPTSGPTTRPIARTPLIARQVWGMGSVTWVARDLGDRTLVQAIPSGWSRIWDRVLGWHDLIVPASASPSQRAQFIHGGQVNLGHVMMEGIDLPARTSGYIAIAILFFILYWLAAGPLSYLVLHSQKRIGLSWYVFAIAGGVATAITVLIVQWVVRGSPQGHHVSLVRLSPGEPAVVTSRLGLYIPNDGNQVLHLPEGAPSRVSNMVPLPLPPDAASGGGYITRRSYDVPVPVAGRTVELSIPYRSTLKKLQTRWIGTSPSLRGIEGSVQIGTSFPWLSGLLTNRTGRDLSDIYLAFKVPQGDDSWQDRIIYLPHWARDADVDLQAILTDRGNRPVFVARIASAVTSPPGTQRRIHDTLYYPNDPARGWVGYWYGQFGGGLTAISFVLRDASQAVPMLSLFDLLPPMIQPAETDRSAVDLLRNDARFVDASAVVEAGGLLILARDTRGDSPLPVPLTLERLFGDQTIQASGTTYYQIILPLHRTDVATPIPSGLTAQ